MKKTILITVTLIIVLAATLLNAFATGAQDTAETVNENEKIIEIPTPAVFAISGLVTVIAAIIIFRKRKIK